MNKRQLHHYYTRARLIRPWYFLIAAVIFLLIGLYALRQNNLTMVQLRQAVATADEQNGDVETALENLRGFVFGHMNTNLSSGKFAIKPPIQLKYRYERLAGGEQKRIKAENAEVTKRAEAVCAARYPAGGYNSPRVACVQKYVQSNATTRSDIPEDLYKFDFISPKWTPDLAGISLVLSGLSFVLALSWYGLNKWAKELSK